MSRNIEEWIAGTHEGSMIIESETDEIGRMERSTEKNGDGVKSRKIEARTREDRGR
jgi:hypothetical protein